MVDSIATPESTRNPERWSIETEYRGTRFRSRLEARWAVFFDTLGIRWEFEPETFVTPHGRYAPDFLLPELQQFVEVKPRSLTQHEWERAQWMAQHTGMGLVVLGKFPEHGVSAYDTADAAAVECVRDHRMGVGAFPAWSAIIEGGAGDFPFMWCRCLHCGRVEWQFNGRAGRMSCRGKSCPPNPLDAKDYSHDDPTINNAYEVARRFRFWEAPR